MIDSQRRAANRDLLISICLKNKLDQTSDRRGGLINRRTRTEIFRHQNLDLLVNFCPMRNDDQVGKITMAEINRRPTTEITLFRPRRTDLEGACRFAMARMISYDPILINLMMRDWPSPKIYDSAHPIILENDPRIPAPK